METDLAKAAYAALQPPPPRGGRAPQPPAKVTTGQRRLLVALHSSYAILADKAAQHYRKSLAFDGAQPSVLLRHPLVLHAFVA